MQGSINDAMSIAFPVTYLLAAGLLAYHWKVGSAGRGHAAVGVLLFVAGAGQLVNNRNFGRGRYFDVPSFAPGSPALDAVFIACGVAATAWLAWLATRSAGRPGASR